MADKAQLRDLNEKSPRKGDLRKAYEIRKGFPTTSRPLHDYFTPSPPDPPFFEPKIFQNSYPATIMSSPIRTYYKPKNDPSLSP